MTKPVTTQYYKWMLRRGGQLVTAVQKRPWPVAVGEWTPEESPLLCESGWHAMEEKDVLAHLPREVGAELWVVETNGATVRGDDKFAASQMRLTHHVGTTDERNLRLFACDVAEDALHLFEAKHPNDDRPRRAIEVARRYARGEATARELATARDTAWTASGAAAWAASWTAAAAASGSASGAASGAASWTAAAAASRAAAEAAVWDSARAASAAVWDSARAASAAARDSAGAASWGAAGAAGAAAWNAGAAARARYSNWLVYRLWGGEDD